MRKPTPTVSASQPTPPPLFNLHTHEVIFRSPNATVTIHCFSRAGAEITARWERPNGAEVEVVEARHD